MTAHMMYKWLLLLSNNDTLPTATLFFINGDVYLRIVIVMLYLYNYIWSYPLEI